MESPQAEQAEVIPYWLTQFETDEQVWKAFVEGQSPMAVTWASRFLRERDALPAEVTGGLLPTLDGSPYTLATGWVWALAGQQPERRALSAQLAAFLVEDAFLAEWSLATGYLPPRPEALLAWPDDALRDLADQLLRAAYLYPPSDVRSSLGPILTKAVVQVLKQQSDPLAAAQTAGNDLENP